MQETEEESIVYLYTQTNKQSEWDPLYRLQIHSYKHKAKHPLEKKQSTSKNRAGTHTKNFENLNMTHVHITATQPLTENKMEKYACMGES